MLVSVVSSCANIGEGRTRSDSKKKESKNFFIYVFTKTYFFYLTPSDERFQIYARVIYNLGL